MPNNISAGDTAWLLMSAALVMLMTPALGFFYGGLVRRKNVLATIMHSFFILCLISVQWVLWGYSLAFGPDKFHLIGGLEWVGLNNVGFTPNADYAATIPHQAYMVFQMMFAVITPALISGAFAERQRFKAFVLFSLLWATFVYDPIAHWVWGAGGWLHNLGALDFAGGTVVHISSGVSALVAALVGGLVGGGLVAPAMDGEAEMEFMNFLLTTWGKTWHTWPDPTTRVPLGEPLLMWSLTGDGQADKELVAERDKAFGVSTAEVRAKRVQAIGYEVPQVLQIWIGIGLSLIAVSAARAF